MVLSPLDTMLLGGLAVNFMTSVSSALPTPKKDGWYSFFFNFLRSFTSGISNAYEQRFHLNLPEVPPGKKSATESVLVTATSSVEAQDSRPK